MGNSIIAFALAGNFEAGTAVLAGIVGALAMLVVMYGGKSMGMTSMDLLRTLGTMVSPKSDERVVYGIGMMMHLMMGAAFGLAHAGLLHAFDPSTAGSAAGIGVGIGVVHGMLIVAMMPIMLTMAHPLVRDGTMAAPGTAMIGFGKMTPMGITMAHVVFGVVAGAIYAGVVG